MTDLVRSREQVRHFLKGMGMSCRRVGVLLLVSVNPASAVYIALVRKLRTKTVAQIPILGGLPDSPPPHRMRLRRCLASNDGQPHLP